MANDKNVDCHCLQGQERIEQRFPFACRGGPDVNVDDMSPQALGCEFEGHPCSRAGFKKQVGDRQSPEFVGAAGELASFGEKAFSSFQNGIEQTRFKALQREEVPEISVVVDLRQHCLRFFPRSVEPAFKNDQRGHSVYVFTLDPLAACPLAPPLAQQAASRD